MGRSLVIPSAGFATRLYPLSQDVPKILVKMNGVPLLHWFYKKAKEMHVDNIIISVNPEFVRRVEEHIADIYTGELIGVVPVDDPDAGPLYSIYSALKSDACLKDVTVMLSDTLYTGEIETDTEFVMYENVTGPLNRWCLVETDEGDKIKRFWDKPQGDCPTCKALIGVYSFQRDGFADACEDIIESKIKVRGEYQISQALELYMTKYELEAIEAKDNAWFDTGTLETLKDTSSDFLTSRSFNYMDVDGGVLTKRSTDKDTLRSEYLWYTAVSDIDSTMVPNIYKYSEGIDYAEIKMELCPLEDLGCIFNFCQSKEVFFEQTIGYIIEDLYYKIYEDRVDGKDKAIDANKAMFIDKLDSRLAQYSGIVIHKTQMAELRQRLHKLCLRTDLISIIHGDLITSNILFHPQRMLVKFIDPRGRYGDFGICGDIRYDLAKLLHSLDGKYETIIQGLYRIHDNNLEYLISKGKMSCFSAAENVLYTLAKDLLDISKEELRLIEASLYFSMIPLHAEDFNRQRAFFRIGTNILDEVL